MKYLLIILFSFSNICAFGQIRFGIKAGTTLSKEESSYVNYPLSDLKYNKSFQTGAYLNIKFFNHFEYFIFQPEVAFIQIGTEYSGNYDFGKGNSEYTDKKIYNYLEMSLNIKLLVPRTSFYVLGGGYAAYFLGGYSNFTNSENVQENELSANEIEILDYDAGYQTGIGIQKGIGSVKFVIEAKYVEGLIDIDKSDLIYKKKYFGITLNILLQSK